MALSVLSLPGQFPNEHGLWDSGCNCFLRKGEENFLYSIKHNMENKEQQRDNEQWMLETVEERLSMLAKAGVSRSKAERIIKKNLPESYAFWQKTQEEKTKNN